MDVRHWHTADGLPQDTVNALARTPDGYLWIGTPRGLVRFDGVRMTTFSRESVPALPSENIVCLHVGTRGELWIGMEDGRLWRLLAGRIDEVHPSDWTLPGRLMGIGQDEREDLWVVHREGHVARLRDRRTYVVEPRDRSARSGTTALARDASTGALFVMHLGTVVRIGSDGLESLSPPAGRPLQALMICPDPERGVWVATPEWTGRFADDAWEGASFRGGSPSTGITSMTVLPGRRLAFGTPDAGIRLVGADGDAGGPVSPDSLRDTWIRTLLDGDRGLVWAGTAVAGLALVHPTGCQLLVPPREWQLRPVKTVAPRTSGGIWAGTEGDGLYAYHAGVWRRFGVDRGLSNPFVWSVAEDRSGRVWTGTWGGGLHVLEDGRFRRVKGLEDGSASIASLLEARDGSMWIGTSDGLWRWRPGGEVDRFGAGHGLAYAAVGALAEGADGTLWFGLADGRIGKWAGGAPLLVGRSPAAADRILSVAVDREGQPWFGTARAGLLTYDGNRLTGWSAEQGIPPGGISYLAIFGDEVFMATDTGIFRSGQEELFKLRGGRSNALPTTLLGAGTRGAAAARASGAQPAACRTEDGVLWFGSTSGVVRLDPGVSLPREVLKPAIEAILADGRTLQETGQVSPGIMLPAGTRRLEIRFTAPMFLVPELVSFRHRLSGDSEWLSGSGSRTAVFERLPPGLHRFELEARMEGQTATLVLPLVLPPTFLQRREVRFVSYLLAAAVVGLGVHLWSRARHRRRLREVHRQHELDRERARIARDIHDDLGASLTRISMMSQTVARDLAHSGVATQRLDVIASTARQLTRKLDEIVWAVSPRHDSVESVAHYLLSFAQEHLSAAGIACRLDVPVTLPQRPLYAESRHQLFLAFQEAIHNVIKHSGAGLALVRLRSEENSLFVQVEDDGRGMPTPALPGARRNGVENMHRRLAEIGGRCEIVPGPGKGTRVSFTVPYDRIDEPSA